MHSEQLTTTKSTEATPPKYRNVYVIGVFDLFHRGHLELLRTAKMLGERLVVAVNGDDMVSAYKRKPLYSETDRLEIVKSLRFVDKAFIIREFDNKEYIEQYDIDAIVHGDDWERASYLEQIRVTESYLESRQIDLVLLPYTQGISTSQLINQIKND